MTSIAAQQEQHVVSRPPTNGFYLVWRAVWWAGLALMIVINLYTSPQSEWTDRDKAVAAAPLRLLTSSYANTSPDREPVHPFAATAAALRLKGGAALVAVDGRPLPAEPTERVATLSGADGALVTLTFANRDGTTHSARIIRSARYEEAAFRGSWISVGGRQVATFLIDSLSRLFGLAAAAVLFLRRPRDPVAALFCFAMILNAFPVATKATMWPGLGGVLVVALSQFSLVLTGLLFPHGRMKTPWHWLALAVALVAFYKDLASDLGYWSPIPITALVGYGANLLSLLALLVAIFVGYRSTPEGVERQQYKPVAFGAGIWIGFFALGLVIDLFLGRWATTEAREAWQTLAFWACYSIAWAGLPLGLLIGLSRYRLYDADSAISRTVAYMAMTAVLLVIFGVVRSVLMSVGDFYFGHGMSTAHGLWGAIISIAALKPLNRWAMRSADKRIRGGLIDLRDDLPVLVGDLRETESTGTVVQATLDAVQHGVHARQAAIVFDGTVLGANDVTVDIVDAWLARWSPADLGRKKLDRDGRDPLFPIRVPLKADAVTGWLLVGPRPDASLQGRDEREVLGKIGKPIARAIAITRAREARDLEQIETIALLKLTIARFDERLVTLEYQSPDTILSGARS